MFLILNIIKIRCRNKIEDNILKESLNLYINGKLLQFFFEKVIITKFNRKLIIDVFQNLKEYHVPF